MYDPMLVPTDGSPAAAVAAEEAFALADELGATVHLIYVVDESASQFLTTGERMSSVLESLTEEGERATAETAALGQDVETITEVVRGFQVNQAIVQYAEANDIELVVMGTHGRRGVDHIIGSTTERTLAQSEVPVLVVPHGE